MGTASSAEEKHFPVAGAAMEGSEPTPGRAPDALSSLCHTASALDLTERNRLVEQHMIIVQRIASKMMWKRQKSFIEKDDLLQEGHLELIKTVDHHPESEMRNLPLAIGSRVKKAILRYIWKETRQGITDVPEDLDQSFIFRFRPIEQDPDPAPDGAHSIGHIAEAARIVATAEGSIRRDVRHHRPPATRTR